MINRLSFAVSCLCYLVFTAFVQGEPTTMESPASAAEFTAPATATPWEWPMGGFTVDEKGWIWFASYVRRPPNPREESAIYAILPQGPDKLGNPIYDWNSAIRVVTDEAGPAALGIKKSDDFQWKLAGRSSDDGMIYGLGEHEKGRRAARGITSHGWQRAPGISGEERGKSRGDFHAKLDACFAEEECRLGSHPGWKRGVIIGGDPRRGGIRHYTKDGLLIGSFRSDPRYGTQPLDWPSGLLDAHLAVNCNRDPRDGILDVWTEDNFNQRLIWYRVDAS